MSDEARAEAPAGAEPAVRPSRESVRAALRTRVTELKSEGDAAPEAPPPPSDEEAPWDGVSLARWPELAQDAQLQLGETRARTAAALTALRSLLGELPELQRPRDLSDAALLRALRARKFRVDFACAPARIAHSVPAFGG